MKADKKMRTHNYNYEKWQREHTNQISKQEQDEEIIFARKVSY